MGSGGEVSNFDSPVYVAVGRNVKEGKSALAWAANNFADTNIRLLYVHQPAASLASFLNGKLPSNKLKTHAINACQEFERLKMEKLMNQYLLFLSQIGKQGDMVCIEMKNVEKGIIQLITQHNIRQLIMGAGTETFNKKKFPVTNSSRAMVICQQAPVSCHVCFISKGRLIYSSPMGPDSHLTTNVPLPHSTSDGGTILRDNKENDQYREHSTTPKEVGTTMNSTDPPVVHPREDSPPLFKNVECPEYLPSSSSNTSLDSEFQEKEACDVHDKLEQFVLDDDKYKKRAFEESLMRWRPEEDVLEDVPKAESTESLCEEEINRNREIGEQLLRQKQELEALKNHHDQVSKELRLIQDQNSVLENRLRGGYSSEKELEDKIIQAVNLMITFKGTRDKLQIEYDSAISKVNKYKALQTEDPSRTLDSHFFGISFSDIIDATQNFNPSQKIGEGRYGSVFKGMIYQAKVAIKMLPSSASQSDSEFKNKVETLSRVRHPNLVNLIGACPESRSLVYEYIGNFSLEDYLSNQTKTSLSWQSRIKIAIDTCSLLVFLHANPSLTVHGNLKPSKILLDSNLVAKISDFGISSLISWIENASDPEKLAYVDPDCLENGELTVESDVYSFGVVMLRLLTGRLASGVVRDVNCAVESGILGSVLDISAGDWPIEETNKLVDLGLRCCRRGRLDRPDFVSEIWAVLKPMSELCDLSKSTCTKTSVDSRGQLKIPSHFVCPIFQEVMKDPHIAEDGYTYEGDAIQGWFSSGHKTSPMTNLELGNCDLIPNYALYYAIQEWQQQNT